MADPSLSAPVAKALARLQQALDAGTAYEGQQVAKAAAARMRSRGSKEEAADLLGRAAEAQLRAGQVRINREMAPFSPCGVGEVERERGERAQSSIEDSKEKRPIDLRSSDLKPQPKPLLSFPCNSLQQITCGSELAASLLEDYEKNGVKLPGDAKASPSGEAPELPEGPPAAVARLLRVLDAFASSSSSSSGAASPSSSAPSSSSRPDATSSLVAAARFASAATKWAGGAGGGKELLGRLHLACAAALSAVASSPASEAAAEPPARPVPTMITVNFRLFAGLMSLESILCLDHF